MTCWKLYPRKLIKYYIFYNNGDLDCVCVCVQLNVVKKRNWRSLRLVGVNIRLFCGLDKWTCPFTGAHSPLLSRTAQYHTHTNNPHTHTITGARTLRLNSSDNCMQRQSVSFPFAFCLFTHFLSSMHSTTCSLRILLNSTVKQDFFLHTET